MSSLHVLGRLGHAKRLIALPIEILCFRFARIMDTNNLRSIQPLISVVIPTMPSRLDLLSSRALKSISNQTFRNLEVILVFDEMNEKISAVLKQYEKLTIKVYYSKPTFKNYPDKKIKWMVGAIKPLNLGIKKSKGAWIARLDDDDEWLPHHLSDSLKFALTNKLDFVSSHCSIVDKSGSRVSPAYRIDDHYFTGKGSDYKPCGPRIGSPITWLMASRLKFIRYDRFSWLKKINKPADLDMATRIFQSGAKIGFIADIHAVIKPRGKSQEIGLAQALLEFE